MIFVIIPVFNRISHTTSVIRQLVSQVASEKIEITIVDAGSTDGTRELVESESKQHSNLRIVNGQPDWYWGRCVQEGIDSIREVMHPQDYVLLLNDDVELDFDYVESALKVLRSNPNCVLGSLLVEKGSREAFHYGVKCNPSKLWIGNLDASEIESDVFRADLASGRGTFYPAGAFLNGLKLSWSKIPHYLSDYDLSQSAVLMGYRVIGSKSVKVYSEKVFGNQMKLSSKKQELFDTKSPNRLLSHWFFWFRFHNARNPIRLALKIARYRLAGLFL